MVAPWILPLVVAMTGPERGAAALGSPAVVPPRLPPPVPPMILLMLRHNLETDVVALTTATPMTWDGLARLPKWYRAVRATRDFALIPSVMPRLRNIQADTLSSDIPEMLQLISPTVKRFIFPSYMATPTALPPRFVDSIVQCQRLQILLLEAVTFQSTDLAFIAQLRAVVKIELLQCDVKRVHHLARCPLLKTLVLMGCPVDGLDGLESAPCLEAVQLSGLPIVTLAPLARIATLRQLRVARCVNLPNDWLRVFGNGAACVLQQLSLQQQALIADGVFLNCPTLRGVTDLQIQGRLPFVGVNERSWAVLAASLPSLTSLNLNMVQVTTFRPWVVCSRLTKIFCNAPFAIFVEHLCKLPALTTLRLNCKELLHQGTLAQCPALTDLDVEGTALEALEGIAGINQLTRLDIQRTGETQFLNLDRLKTTTLQSLTVASTSVSDLAPILRRFADSLTYLSASGCPIDFSSRSLFTNASHLTSLNLSHTKAPSDAVAPLSCLPRLKALDVRATLIGDDIPWERFRALVELEASDTQIGDASITRLATIRTLTVLYVRRCPALSEAHAAACFAGHLSIERVEGLLDPSMFAGVL